jgi:hypothetical protein
MLLHSEIEGGAFTLRGDEPKYTLVGASGGGTVTLTWKRTN